MAVTRGTFSQAKLLEPGLNKIYEDAGAQHETEYTAYFNMKTSTRRYEEDSEVVMLGVTPTKAEGATTAFDDPIANPNQKRYVHVARGLATRITHEAIQDELYGIINKVPAALSRANDETMELSGINLFINGFASGLGDASTNDINGEDIFHAGHSKLNGGTYDANSVTDAYGFTALQAASNYFEGQTNDRGLRMRMKMAHLILPFELRFIDREIWGSTQRPFTGDNEPNSLLAEGRPTTSFTHYSTSATAWWALGDNKEDHFPNWFTREAASFAADDDFLTRDVLNRTYMRYSLGVTKAVGMYGSTGV